MENTIVKNQFITCPNCSERIPLTKALTSHIEEELKLKYENDYKENIERIAKQAAESEREKNLIKLSDLENQLNEKNQKIKSFVDHELELNKRARELDQKQIDLKKEALKIVEEQKEELINKAKADVKSESLVELEDLKNQLIEKEEKIKKLYDRELELNKKDRELKEREKSINDEANKILEDQKNIIIKKAKEEAKKENNLEVSDLRNELDELKIRLHKANENELELRKKQRELENEKNEFEVTKSREIDAAKAEIYQKAKTDSDVEYQLKMREKDEQMRSMTTKIEELKKKAEQGSQQLQGEAQELELEDFLSSNFPLDDIIPVGKGQKGADIIQNVKNEHGINCGLILWESKRHKAFDKKWVQKLKEDQRNEKANVAVIVSQVLPENINNFGLLEGVWISNYTSTLGIALALRENLLQINKIKLSEVGKNQKMEAMYNYLVSHEFSQRIEAIMEAFDKMKEQINSERKVFEKQWAERDSMLSQVLRNTTGMYGDLQGLIGSSLPSIKAIELPKVSEDESETTEIIMESDSDEFPF